MRVHFGKASLVLALAVWFAPISYAEGAPAHAAPLSEALTGSAKAEYDAGKILYADGDYAGAALKFGSAYDLSKDPRLLWNMAGAEKNHRHYARVEQLVKRYVSESGAAVNEADRA